MSVSIIIPAFDAADTISDTLTSVLAQTDTNWEAVVVDDGSRDETGRIAAEFAERDPRIRVIRQPNGGEAAARNTGVAAAQHDWLLFLDADDWISPDYLQRMSTALTADTTLDAVHCGSARVASDGSLLVERYQPPTGDMFTVWARRSAFPVHACIIRKSLVEEIGCFDVSLRKSADWDFWQRAARTGARFGAVRDVLAFYRMRPHAASLAAPQMLQDGLRVLKQGHGPDRRVAHPHPDHANGLPPEQVPAQAFYLLSWCAGLLLGTNEDARPLLQQVDGMHFPALYPDAVAQCIFDAAPLPTCQSPKIWEELWPTVHGQVDAFLVALEAHAKAPDLASRARAVLTRMSLKHSSTWRTVIEADDEQRVRLEATITQQQASIEQLVKSTGAAQRLNDERAQLLDVQQMRIDDLDRAKALLESELSEQRLVSDQHRQTIRDQAAHITGLEEARTSLEQQVADLLHLNEEHLRIIGDRNAQISHLEDSVARSERSIRNLERIGYEKERLLAQLRSAPWVRLGNRLKLVGKEGIAIADVAANPDPTAPTEARTMAWQLLVGEGSAAALAVTPHDAELVRVTITKAGAGRKWDIQLNHAGFGVVAHTTYRILFQARADRRRKVIVGFAQAHPPWSGLGLYRTLALTSEWQAFEEEFASTADEANARIHFDLSGSSVAVEVRSVSLRSEADGRLVLPQLGLSQPGQSGA